MHEFLISIVFENREGKLENFCYIYTIKECDPSVKEITKSIEQALQQMLNTLQTPDLKFRSHSVALLD